jgi:sec-independent protein translocase protein TatA
MGASLASPTHLIVLALVCLLLFGAKRLPEIGRSLGSGMREFKTSVTGMEGIQAIDDSRVDIRNTPSLEITALRDGRTDPTTSPETT